MPIAMVRKATTKDFLYIKYETKEIHGINSYFGQSQLNDSNRINSDKTANKIAFICCFVQRLSLDFCRTFKDNS